MSNLDLNYKAVADRQKELRSKREQDRLVGCVKKPRRQPL